MPSRLARSELRDDVGCSVHGNLLEPIADIEYIVTEDDVRPTLTNHGVRLDAFTLGELISLYEMVTFVEGTVWGIDSYDQWGVELGKQLAKQITPAFHDDAAKAEQDASTQALIEFYRAHRK